MDDGIHDIDTIRERVLSNVRSLSQDTENEIDAAIDRLTEKQILERSDNTVRLT